MNNQNNREREDRNKQDRNEERRNCLRCDVCNCIHNDQHCGCTAREVSVGPDFASSCNDTVCGTFRKSEY